MTHRIALLTLIATLAGGADRPAADTQPARRSGVADEGVVVCANLTYDRNKTSVCFADRFLSQIQQDAGVRTEGRFRSIRLDADELFRCPFAVMTGEGPFQLTDAQRKNLRTYLERGGFLLASAGCSDSRWNQAFRAELKKTFPDRPFVKLPMTHPVFHTVYDIDQLRLESTGQARLEGLEINGKLVLIYSAQGLNDTANAGKGCCCCGGSEILNAQSVNVNILAYALTH